jgi:hypothetical protein
MKRVYGLVAITALFISCTQSPPPAPAPAPAAPAAKAYGTLAQMMRGIPFPNSNIIFDTQTNDPGAPQKPVAGGAGTPATQQYSGVYGGWTAVENAAIALQETANLILIPGRMCENGQPVPVDQADFQKWAQGLADAGAAAYKAAQAKNIDQMVEVAGTVSDACAACHEKYRDTPDQPKDRCMTK